MPQVKLHVSGGLSSDDLTRLVQAIRESIPIALGIDDRMGQVMLYESAHRSSHASRDQRFVFVEVTMYSGRNQEFKQRLAEMILSEIEKHTGVGRADINLVYYELSPDAYFGGTSHRYIEELVRKPSGG